MRRIFILLLTLSLGHAFADFDSTRTKLHSYLGSHSEASQQFEELVLKWEGKGESIDLERLYFALEYLSEKHSHHPEAIKKSLLITERLEDQIETSDTELLLVSLLHNIFDETDVEPLEVHDFFGEKVLTAIQEILGVDVDTSSSIPHLSKLVALIDRFEANSNSEEKENENILTSHENMNLEIVPSKGVQHSGMTVQKTTVHKETVTKIEKEKLDFTDYIVTMSDGSIWYFSYQTAAASTLQIGLEVIIIEYPDGNSELQGVTIPPPDKKSEQFRIKGYSTYSKNREMVFTTHNVDYGHSGGVARKTRFHRILNKVKGKKNRSTITLKTGGKLTKWRYDFSNLKYTHSAQEVEVGDIVGIFNTGVSHTRYMISKRFYPFLELKRISN